MTQLTDTQRQILATACTQPSRIALPLPERLQGGAATKVVAALMAKGLLAEVDAKPGEPLWRETDDGPGDALLRLDAAVQVGSQDDAGMPALGALHPQAMAVGDFSHSDGMAWSPHKENITSSRSGIDILC